jgi:hypothetical protein
MPLLTWYGIVGDGREEVLGDFQIFCYSRDSVMHTGHSFSFLYCGFFTFVCLRPVLCVPNVADVSEFANLD